MGQITLTMDEQEALNLIEAVDILIRDNQDLCIAPPLNSPFGTAIMMQKILKDLAREFPKT